MKSARLCLLASLAAAASAQVEWTNLGGLTSRSAHATAYDAARGVVVVFGGLGPALRVLGDTWEWDGARWTQRVPVTQPPARHGAAMAYDSRRRRTILFGGWAPAGSRSDTWAWDGNDWTRLAATGPDPRLYTSMAYDEVADRVVLFGGDRRDSRSNLGDTWLWDGAAWTLRTPGSAPAARMSHAMAYDATRQRVVLTGGQSHPRGGSLTVHADCWEWDGANDRWVAAAPPPARCAATRWPTTRSAAACSPTARSAAAAASCCATTERSGPG